MSTRNAKCQTVGVCAEYFYRMYYNLLEGLTITNYSKPLSILLGHLDHGLLLLGKELAGVYIDIPPRSRIVPSLFAVHE